MLMEFLISLLILKSKSKKERHSDFSFFALPLLKMSDNLEKTLLKITFSGVILLTVLDFDEKENVDILNYSVFPYLTWNIFVSLCFNSFWDLWFCPYLKYCLFLLFLEFMRKDSYGISRIF